MSRPYFHPRPRGWWSNGWPARPLRCSRPQRQGRARALLAAGALLLLIGRPDGPVLSEESGEDAGAGRVDEVVVYPDRALVTRRITFEGPPRAAGPRRLVVRPLPLELRDDSLRATVTSGGGRILDVEAGSYPVPVENDEILKKLRAQAAEIRKQEEPLEDQQSLIAFRQRYLESAQQHYLGEKARGREPGRSVREYDAMLEYLSERALRNLSEARRIRKALADLKEKRNFVERKIADRLRNRRRSAREKQVAVLVEGGGRTVSIELTYVVGRASWKPGYDVRILRKENRIEFDGYGLVSQSSGEDWPAARVKLSTARPAGLEPPPEMEPLYVGSSGSRGGSVPGGGAPGRAGGAGARGGSLVFAVPKTIPIAADGRPHRTSFTRHTLPVTFEYITFPRHSDTAYLIALGKNDMAAPILAGQLNLFHGNDFFGASQSGSVLPGETFELTLGSNENIRVTRRLEEMAQERTGLISRGQSFRYAYSIRVGNYSDRDAVVNVVDQIPVSRGEEVRVTDVTHSPAPDFTNKQGILKWRIPLKSKATTTIQFSFTVLVPEGRAPDFFRTEEKRGRQLRDLENDERAAPSSGKNRGPALQKYRF